MAEIKLANDLVNLVNKADKDQEFQYNGTPYNVVKGKFVQVERFIAEHGIRKTAVMDISGHTATMEIVELPADQRSKEGMSKAASELVEARAKIKEQEDLIQTLLDENKAIREKNEKLEKRLARS